MKQDRFLTGILIGIGALILIALVLFFTRQEKKPPIHISRIKTISPLMINFDRLSLTGVSVQIMSAWMWARLK